MIDWLAILSRYNIEYVTSGKNVARGNINIHCIFCGDSDRSHHLGINLETGKWGCWRDSSHRGVAPHKLLRELTGLSNSEVDLFINNEILDDFDPNTLFNTESKLIHQYAPAELPSCFRSFAAVGDHGQYFLDYLSSRYLPGRETVNLYQLRYCIVGRYKWRLIIPSFFNHVMVAWAARSILPQEPLRYLANSLEEGSDIKQTIFNYDQLQEGGDILIINEGPFDAMKLDFYGREIGIRATCLWGVILSEQQEALLYNTRKQFRKVVMMMDEPAYAMNLVNTEILHYLKIEPFFLPNTVKDTGGMTPEEINELLFYLKQQF